MCGLFANRLPGNVPLSLARSYCSSAVGLTCDQCSEGSAAADLGCAMPLVAIDYLDHTAKQCHTARDQGD